MHYPWHLNQCIQGRRSHLSNNDVMQLLAEVKHRELEHVILAHLSEENNTQKKALRCVGEAVANDRVM